MAVTMASSWWSHLWSSLFHQPRGFHNATISSCHGANPGASSEPKRTLISLAFPRIHFQLGLRMRFQRWWTKSIDFTIVMGGSLLLVIYIYVYVYVYVSVYVYVYVYYIYIYIKYVYIHIIISTYQDHLHISRWTYDGHSMKFQGQCQLIASWSGLISLKKRYLGMAWKRTRFLG